MSAEEVAKAFVQHYYQSFDSNVESLGSLFVRAEGLHPPALCRDALSCLTPTALPLFLFPPSVSFLNYCRDRFLLP
jgi:hypothetical protein